MLPYTTYTNDDQTRSGMERIAANLSAIPGVDRVAIAGDMPVFHMAGFEGFIIEGQPPPQKEATPFLMTDPVSPGFFAALGIKILAGRDFSTSDRTGSQNVVIICFKMARKFWPRGDAIGHRISSTDSEIPNWQEIVGVVNDIKLPGAPDAFQRPYQAYHPIAQDANQHWFTFAIHSQVDPDTLTDAARWAVAKADSNLAISDLQTVASTLRESRKGLYSIESVIVFVALMGLLLSVVGIYAVIANLAVQRTKEIGVRIALGAPSKAIVWLLLRNGIRLAGFGTGIGLLLAFAIARVFEQRMPYLHGQDPILIFELAALLATSTLLASCLPALRATRVDPLEALRAE
jgi:predicted permease